MTRKGFLRFLLVLIPAMGISGMALVDVTSERIQRGRYLVEDVAQCWECHSPRDSQGRPDRSRWLLGAPVWFQPVHPTPNWAYSAPPLAGLPSFTKEQTLRILEAGLGPQGLPVRPPMHLYHMAPDDAEAVIAYLQSLK